MVFRGRISIRGKSRGSRKRGRGIIIGEPREIFKPGNAPKSEPVFRMANTSANVDEALSRQPWPPNSSNYEDDRDVNNSSNYGKSFSPPRIHPNDRRSPERLSERSSRGSHSSSLSKSSYDSYKGGRSRDKSRSPERKRHRSRSHSRSRTRHRSRSRHRSPSKHRSWSKHRSRSRNRSRSRSRRSRSTDRRRSTSRNRDQTRLQAVSRNRSPSIISSNSEGDSRKMPVTSDPALLQEENRRGLFPLPTESLRITVGNERFTERGEFPTVSEDILQDAIEIVKDYQSSVKDFGRRQESSDSHLDSLGKEIPLDTFRSHSLEKKFSPSYSSLYSSRDHIDSSKSHQFDRKSPSPVRKRELHLKRDDPYQHHKPSSSSTSRQSSSSLKSILKQKEESFFSKSGAVMIPGLDAVHDIDDEEAFLYGEESRSHKTKERKIDKNDSVKKISNLTEIRTSSNQSKNSHSVHNPSLDIIQSKSEAAKKELANILQVIGFGVPQDAIERIKLKAESMDETLRLQEARMKELKNKDYKTKDSKELLFEQNSSFPEDNLNMPPLNQRVSGVETNWNQIPVNPIQSRQDPSYPEYPSVPMQHSEYPKVQSHHSDFPQVKSDHPDFSQIPNQHPYYWPQSSLPPPHFPYPPPQPPYGPPSLHHMPGPLPPHYGYDTPLNDEVQPSRSNLRVIPIQNSSESMQELSAKSNFKNLVKENKISHGDSPPIKKAVEPVKELKPILKKSNIDEVKKEIKSELPKENAQKFASREEYLSMLVNKQTDYTFLISNLNKEIDYLRKQQGELMRKNRKQKDGHKDPLLLENTLLQDEISRKVKDITQHLDDVKAAIKDINTNQSNFRSALTIRRILSEVALKKDKDKQEKSDETLYEYFDSGNHWCRNCNEKAASMFEMLDHIQSQQHKQNLDPFLRPWRKEAAKTTTISSRPKSNVFVAPIKGFEFLIPAASFYCQLCNEFSGDSNSAFDHLKTPEHHKKYLKYTEENQFYERRLNLEKAVGLILRKEKLKRRNEDAIELERKAKEQKKYENEKEIDKLLAYKISQSESSEGSPTYKKPDTNNSETKKLETKISEPKSPETKQTEIENEAEMDDSFGFGKFSWKKDNPSANDVSVLENEGTDAKSLKSKIAIKLTGKTVIPSTAATPWQPVMKRLLVNKPVLIKKGPMFPLRKTKVERQDKPVPLDVFLNLKIGTGQAAKVDSPQTLISQEDISAAFSGKEVDTDIDVTIPQDVTPEQAVDSTISEKLNIKSNSVKEPNSVDQQKAADKPNISEAQTTKQIFLAEIAPISAEKVTAETAGLIASNVSTNDSFVFKVPNQPDINYRSKVVKETKPVPTGIQTSLSNKGNIKEPLISSSQNSLSIQNISPQKSTVISLLKNTEMQDKESISDQNTKYDSLPIVTISDISSTPQPNESSILSSSVSAEEMTIFGPHLPENVNEKEIEKFNTEKLSVESRQVLVTAGNEQNEYINMLEMPTSTTEILVAPHTVLKDENQICTPSGSLEQTKNIETLKFEPNPEKIEDNESSNILSMIISKDTILKTEENKQVQENACNFTCVEKTVNIDFQSDNQIAQENLMSENVSSCLEMMTNQTDIEIKNLEESILKTSLIPNENVVMNESTNQKIEISFSNQVTPQLEKMEILIEANQGGNSCQLIVDTSTDKPSSNEMIIDSTETISVLQETSKEFGVLIETNATLTEEKQTDCLSIQSGASNLENKVKDYVSPISIVAVDTVTPINEDMENILLPGENISPIIVNDLICQPTINISDKDIHTSIVLNGDDDKNKMEKISHPDIKKNQIVENIFEKEKIKPSINLEVIDETKVQIIQNIEPSVSSLEPSQTLNNVYKEMIESETKEATSTKVITKRKSGSKHNLIDISESIIKPVIRKKKGISEEKHIGLKEVRIVIERCDEQSKTVSLKSSIDKISKVTTADKFVKNDGGKKMKMDENLGKNKNITQTRDEKPEDKSVNKHHKKKKGKEINEVKDSYLGEEIKNESTAKIIIDVESEKSDVHKIDCEISNFPVGQEHRNIVENKINEYVDKKNNFEVSESKTLEPEREMIGNELEENVNYKTSEIQVENKTSKIIENKEMIDISPKVNETKIKVGNEKLKGEIVINEFVGKSDDETTEIPDINKLENWVEIKISDAQNDYKALAIEGKHEDKAESEQARNESEINCEIIEIQSVLEHVNKVENEINKKSANKVEVSWAKTVEHESKLEIENLENQYKDKKIENDYENRIENETNKSEIEYGDKKNSNLIVAKTIEGKHENNESELNERKSEHEYERKTDYAENKIEIENISEFIDRNDDMRIIQSGAKTIENEKAENEKSNAYEEKIDFEISEIPIKDECENKAETERIEIKVDSGYKLDENDSEIKKVEENQIEKEISLGINKMHYEISDNKNNGENEINISKDESDSEKKNVHYKITIKDADRNKVETKKVEIDFGYKDENNYEIGSKAEEIEENKEMGQSILTKVEEYENKIDTKISEQVENDTSKLKVEDKLENLKMDYKISTSTKLEIKTMEYEINKITVVEDTMDEVNMKFEYRNRTEIEINPENTSEIKKVDKYEDKIENKVRDDEKFEGIDNETSLPQSNVNTLENPLDKGSTLEPIVERCNERQQIPDKKATEIEINFENVDRGTTETDKAKDISIKSSQIGMLQTFEQKLNKDNSESCDIMTKIGNQESVNIKVMVPEQLSTIEVTSLLKCPIKVAEIDNNTCCTDTKTEAGTVNEKESISAIPSGSSEEQMKSNSDVQMFSVLEVLTKMCEETASNPSRLESTSFTAESDKTSSTYSLVESTKHSNVDSSSNQTSDLLAPITICQFKGTDESEVNDSMNEASSECQHLPDDEFKNIEEKK